MGLISYDTKSVQICFGKFSEQFLPKKPSKKKNLSKFGQFELQTTTFKKLLKKLNLERFLQNGENVKTVILQGSRSLSTTMYGSESLR